MIRLGDRTIFKINYLVAILELTDERTLTCHSAHSLRHVVTVVDLYHGLLLFNFAVHGDSLLDRAVGQDLHHKTLLESEGQTSTFIFDVITQVVFGFSFTGQIHWLK